MKMIPLRIAKSARIYPPDFQQNERDGRSETKKTEKAGMVHMPAFSFPSESAAKERGDRRLPGMDQRRVLSRAIARARAALEW